MSSKRKQPMLSESSSADSDSDAGSKSPAGSASPPQKRGRKDSGSSRSGSNASSRASSKGRASSASPQGRASSGSASPKRNNRKRSGSGSARSRSGSSSSSASSAKSKSASRSRSRSGSRSASNKSDKSGSGSDGSSRAASRASNKNKSSNSSSDSAQSNFSSGSEKGKKLKKAGARKPSAALAKSLSSASDSEDDDRQAVAEKSKPAQKRGRKAAVVREESSDDNNEEAWRKEFDDGLDDQYIGDDEDRAKLSRMTEREREEELFRRAEKREELKKRYEISRKLRLQQKNREETERREQKELSSEGELRDDEPDDKEDDQSDAYRGNNFSDPGSRKKGYEEKYGKKFSALNELKAKREEKERKEREKNKRTQEKNKTPSDSDSGSDYEKLGQKKKKKVLRASEIYSSTSSEGEERRRSSSSSSSSSESGGESDTERQDSKKIVKKARLVDTKEDLERIRLSRYKLDKFCHLPIFKKTVIGCFVRVGIGKNHQENKDVYRCCEVTDVCETGKIYKVMNTQTNLGLRLRHGKEQRVFRLQFVSNSPFTESEFQKWRAACEFSNTELPSMGHIEQKEKDMVYARDYRFSSADVEKIIASKQKFQNRPKNYAMAKAKLMKERDMAVTMNDHDKAEELNARLDDLESRAEELDKMRTHTIATISLINDRNRKNNVERAYQGIRQDEKKRQQEGKMSDPFTRRKTLPVMSKLAKDENNEMVKPEAKKHLIAKEVLLKPRKKNDGAPITLYDQPKPKEQEVAVKKIDVFDAHNFDLDINVDETQATPLTTPAVNLKPVTAVGNPTGPAKRSIKLEEWKKKRGII